MSKPIYFLGTRECTVDENRRVFLPVQYQRNIEVLDTQLTSAVSDSGDSIKVKPDDKGTLLKIGKRGAITLPAAFNNVSSVVISGVGKHFIIETPEQHEKRKQKLKRHLDVFHARFPYASPSILATRPDVSLDSLLINHLK